MKKIKHKHSLLCLGISAFIGLFALRAFADNPAGNTNVKFVESNTPPPGFEDSVLNVTETNYISVYYGGQFIGNITSTYNDNTVKLSDVTTIVNKIPGIKNANAVVQALSGALPNNADHLCPADNNPQNRPYCSIITTPIAGVIFDPNNYVATIFVNPDYLTVNEQTVKTASLPNSTAGFSYLGANNFAISTTSGQQTYSLNNQSYFADGNSMLNLQSNLTQTNTTATTGSNNASSATYTVQNIGLSRLVNGKYYQVGMMMPYTGFFINGQTILGVSMQNYGIIPIQAQGTPIQVFLPLPAQVAVYKNGYLISTQSFDAGKQLLDTSSFPVGSYDVQLKITNSLGQTTTQTQFFVKQPSLPPKGEPDYQVSMGMMQSNQNSSGGSGIILPSFLTEPFFDYTETRKVGNNFGLQSTIVTNFNRAYLTEALAYYGANFQLAPGVLVSNNQQYGWLVNFSFIPQRWPNFSLSSNNQKIFGANTGSLAQQTGNPLVGSNFSPLTQTSFQSNNLANLSIGQKTTLSANYQITEIPGQVPQTQYGGTFSRTLIANSLLTLQMTGTLTKATGNNVTISIGLSVGFFTANNLSISLGAGADNTTQITNTTTGTTYNQYEPNYNATVTKNYYWGDSKHDNLGITGSVNHTYSADTDSLSSYFTTGLAAGNLNFSRNLTRSYTNTNGTINTASASSTQISGNVQSNVVYSQGHWAYGYQGSNTSGLLVYLTAPDHGASADIFVNGQNAGVAKTNKPTALFLSPYQTYNVTISPNGEQQYGFDQAPKPVTLYNGNIQFVQWVLTKQYILFAKIIDTKGNALGNSLLESKNVGDFNVTDAGGYIQANIDSDQTLIKFKQMSGNECVVTIPKTAKPNDDGLILLSEPLVCH